MNRRASGGRLLSKAAWSDESSGPPGSLAVSYQEDDHARSSRGSLSGGALPRSAGTSPAGRARHRGAWVKWFRGSGWIRRTVQWRCPRALALILIADGQARTGALTRGDRAEAARWDAAERVALGGSPEDEPVLASQGGGEAEAPVGNVLDRDHLVAAQLREADPVGAARLEWDIGEPGTAEFKRGIAGAQRLAQELSAFDPSLDQALWPTVCFGTGRNGSRWAIIRA
jgi:hypothetical protein